MLTTARPETLAEEHSSVRVPDSAVPGKPGMSQGRPRMKRRLKNSFSSPTCKGLASPYHSAGLCPRGYKIHHHKTARHLKASNPGGGLPTSEEDIGRRVTESAHPNTLLGTAGSVSHCSPHPDPEPQDPQFKGLEPFSVDCPFPSPDHRGWGLHCRHLRSGKMRTRGFFSVLSIFCSSCWPLLCSRPERDPLSCFLTGFL